MCTALGVTSRQRARTAERGAAALAPVDAQQVPEAVLVQHAVQQVPRRVEHGGWRDVRRRAAAVLVLLLLFAVPACGRRRRRGRGRRRPPRQPRLHERRQRARVGERARALGGRHHEVHAPRAHQVVLPACARRARVAYIALQGRGAAFT